jgi:hypothetical protein
MKNFYLLLVLCLCWLIVSPVSAQQILDPANYYTVDNFPNSPTSTLDADSTTQDTPEYKEVGPWYTGAQPNSHGGGHRQTSRLGGVQIGGRSATWIATIPPDKGGTYLVYTYVLQAFNNSSNVYYTLQREFESTLADSVRHDERLSMLSPTVGVGLGAWVPLMIDNLNPGKVFVRVGADSLSGSSIMRADAVRLLRSSSEGADLEFGRRPYNTFNTNRATEYWLDASLGSITYKTIQLFNIGKQNLTVNNAYTKFLPNRWDIKVPNNGTFPIVIPPGQKKSLLVGFRPFQEETIADTLVIESNDSLEVAATLPLNGTGINYNFILNTSLTNEPHYNAPFDNVVDARRPEITLTGSPWVQSGTGVSPYPVTGLINLFGLVNIPQDPLATVEYKFQLPDSLNGVPGSTGYYYIEYGLFNTSNSEPAVQVRITTPFSTDTVKTVFSENLASGPPPYWRIIGDKSYLLNQGGYTKVRFAYPSVPGGYLRADLLRIRKVPTGPSIAAPTELNFNNVSIYSNQRTIDNNYHKDLEINSGGESALRIDSIVITNRRYYSITNLPTFPTLLAAINGSLKLNVNFIPDTIANGLNTTIRIYTNDSTKNPLNVAVTGNGIGTALTLEESNTLQSYLYPQNPVTYPDLLNMNKWQTITDVNASGGSRLVGYIYYLQGDPALPNKAGYVEYFPNIPTLEGHGPELDTFNVYIRKPAGSANSTPKARYRVFEAGGVEHEIILAQDTLASTYLLGQFVFLRSNSRDAHGGSAINGFIRLENDTNLVNDYYKDSLINRARRDTFVIRADAIILREISPLTDVAYEVLPEIPNRFNLSQNFPNPFNPTTQIKFDLPKAATVELSVYDILGREVRRLVNERYNAGSYTVTWDGRNNRGSQVATGMYVYRLRAGSFVSTKKMLMLK